jgi:protein-tyrosine kinase
MENIRQALERVRATLGDNAGPSHIDYADRGGRFVGPAVGSSGAIRGVALKSSHLQANRIVSHMVTDPRSRAFDMLRTQILQAMDLKGAKILAVTSPTANCGKTVTAVNLALSIARQPQRSAFLIDFDFQRPRVAQTLGLSITDGGALGVLTGRTTVANAVTNARIGEHSLLILPTQKSIASSSLVASQEMTSLMQALSKDRQSRTIIIDLPPILVGDDVISLLPKVDCVLLVAGVGTSTVAQVEECSRHLQSADVVRIVVNKVPETGLNYYYYY